MQNIALFYSYTYMEETVNLFCNILDTNFTYIQNVWNQQGDTTIKIPLNPL